MDEDAQAITGEEAAQSEAAGFLRSLGAQAHESSPPALTHISRVFFAGARAYKLKRAVRTPYLDFTTLEARCAACAREVELNRRTAPDLYLGLRRINHTVEVIDTPAIRGMIKRVNYLVKCEG
ncbi:MAG: hypothetical protein EBT83_13140 [Betaproteobacteria bacterium]|nr:hypothetical protein [Betaproteobacteria bacterium]